MTEVGAPMQSTVVQIVVGTGEAVDASTIVVVLEAMKMEHVVEAPHAGAVREICVALGEQVAAGAVLLELGDEQ
jgi:3-methylcrotonyl-CoA carboxylase alpha subunit